MCRVRNQQLHSILPQCLLIRHFQHSRIFIRISLTQHIGSSLSLSISSRFSHLRCQHRPLRRYHSRAQRWVVFMLLHGRRHSELRDRFSEDFDRDECRDEIGVGFSLHLDAGGR
ncbi:uncharacterized protein LOC122049206 [Zingiber officinale]|uniref:uncharacterized protein LOC122049206 n=1 Tax=Zingiber officinale TaxID=94328 RepID=UPI001C4D9719|nr:uncharacterized protein LOC122049206 [Zingiber officinale]